MKIGKGPNLFFIVIIFLECMTSCDSFSRFKEKLLKEHSKKGQKLELVLETFKKDDSKFKAANFLINNIISHFSYDTTGFSKYNIVLNLSDSPSNQKATDSLLVAKVNPIWDSLKKRTDPKMFFNRKVVRDIISLNSYFLINSIENSYNSWQANPYTKDLPVDIYCKHILPYRIIDGVLPDDYFGDYNKELIDIVKRVYPAKIEDAVDSILYRYSNIKYSITVLPDFPYLSPSSIIKTKRGECDNRIWFNYYMLRSAGFAIAIDFVPAWGNRNTSHTWNALITENGSIPFEPFYSSDRWEYKKIYNNLAEDGFVEWWGKFRLPKVYRRTYEIILNDLLKDNNIPKEDIPPLFRSINIKDVSDEYFDAVDVSVTIDRDIPEKVKFVFLCVSKQDKWVPVDYAKIKWGKARFKKIGKDIVYLPAFYKNGNIIPASEPFYLSQKGKVQKFKSSGKRFIMDISRRYPLNMKKDKSNSLLKGSYFLLSNKADFSDSIISAKVDFNLEMMTYQINNAAKGKFRYVRFIFNPNAILSELKIYNKENIAPIIHFPNISPGESSYKLVDGDLGTPLRWSMPKNKKDNIYIDFDFRKPVEISQFQLCGIHDIFHIEPNVDYEVFYWNDKWVSLGGVHTSKERKLLIENTPEGALYYIDCHDKWTFERIFKYNDGKQIFY